MSELKVNKFDFASLLTPGERRSLIKNRINQFAAEAYQTQLNREVAVSSGDENQIANADKVLTTLEIAVAVHTAELLKIPEE